MMSCRWGTIRGEGEPKRCGRILGSGNGCLREEEVGIGSGSGKRIERLFFFLMGSEVW